MEPEAYSAEHDVEIMRLDIKDLPVPSLNLSQVKITQEPSGWLVNSKKNQSIPHLHSHRWPFFFRNMPAKGAATAVWLLESSSQ